MRHLCDRRVVGDHRSKRAQLLMNTSDGFQDHRTRLYIESTRGLIAQQNVWSLADRPGDGNSLLLAARELRWKVESTFIQADQSQRFARVQRRLGDVSNHLDIFQRGQRRDQIVELEDEADMFASIVCERLVVRSR